VAGSRVGLKETLAIGKTPADTYVAKINEVTEVTLGEPDPSPSERPLGFTERSPSDRSAEWQKLHPNLACPPCAKKRDAELDEVYRRKRSDLR
jgi:hypothetical protein